MNNPETYDYLASLGLSAEEAARHIGVKRQTVARNANDWEVFFRDGRKAFQVPDHFCDPSEKVMLNDIQNEILIWIKSGVSKVELAKQLGVETHRIDFAIAKTQGK